MHSQEEFLRLAPIEARTEDVLANEHQLMLNRLGFELAERQRYCLWPMHHCLCSDLSIGLTNA